MGTWAWRGARGGGCAAWSGESWVSAGGTHGGAQAGTSGQPEDLNQWVVTAPRKDEGGGEAPQGAWGRKGREGHGPEGWRRRGSRGASGPHQARCPSDRGWGKGTCPVAAGTGVVRGTGAPWAFWGRSGSRGCKPFGTHFPSACRMGFGWGNTPHSPQHPTPPSSFGLFLMREKLHPCTSRLPKEGAHAAATVRGVPLCAARAAGRRMPGQLPVLPGGWGWSRRMTVPPRLFHPCTVQRCPPSGSRGARGRGLCVARLEPHVLPESHLWFLCWEGDDVGVGRGPHGDKRVFCAEEALDGVLGLPDALCSGTRRAKIIPLL